MTKRHFCNKDNTPVINENKEKMKTHKDLEVWKKSIQMVTKIYKETANFPKQELYGLTSQIRRSASVPSNIAEGAGRKHTKEFIQFYIFQWEV